jgi:hypothetical protein
MRSSDRDRHDRILRGAAIGRISFISARLYGETERQFTLQNSAGLDTPISRLIVAHATADQRSMPEGQ